MARKKSADFEPLRELVRHHIESFDYMLDEGLSEMFDHVKPVICRQAKISYTGKLMADVEFQYLDAGSPVVRERFNFGQFPVMLKTRRCHLQGADSQKLVSLKEEAAEMGGCVRKDQSSVTLKLYYLLNGSARLGFWLQGKEYLLPLGIVLKKRAPIMVGFMLHITCCLFSELEHAAGANNLTRKALVDTNDLEIFNHLTCCYEEKYKKEKGAVGSPLVSERVKIILAEVQDLSLTTRLQCLQHIGEHFQPVIDGLQSESYYAVAETVIRDYIFVHLNDNNDKFNLLIFMLQKLFSLVDHTSVSDNPDSLQNQEILLPGHLITIYLKEKLEDWLRKGKKLIQDEIENNGKKFDFFNCIIVDYANAVANIKKVMEKNPSKQIGTSIETMLKTGRLATQTGLDLQQRAGYTVQAERLNFLRFISFFRAVHRGASFAGLRTTSVRKLLPESWGFLCPVHTPDGEPCGLLNHMTSTCRVASYYDSRGNIRDFSKMRTSILRVLIGVGMIPSLPKLVKSGPPAVLSVLLDGRVVGVIPSSEIEKVVAHLRRLKVSAASVIPDDLEVGYVPLSLGGAYPGLYLFTSPPKFVRPVRNISLPSEESQNIELIGPFEQVFMEIRCPDGGDGGRRNAFPATHEEIHPTGMLSVVANLTPYSDHNQSPRNMYQCQMAKQTMGFSVQALKFRADQKLYHLQCVLGFVLHLLCCNEYALGPSQTPQTPIVRTNTYTKYGIDEYPTGTNAIVAVLAYTGYDMEDAMILNKSSVDRGMCHGQIYQTETIDLSDDGNKVDRGQKLFRRNKDAKSLHSVIDSDGLPYVGQMIHPGEPYCSIYDKTTNSWRTNSRKGSESVFVDYVAVDMKNSKNLPQKANIRFRHTRNPIIGDKFSSRHGQKGVCSQLWPDIDMPFSGVTGMRPDLIINPHAFPSRMTIAMLLESVAAKGGSLHGKFMDATPFANSVKKTNGDTGTDESKSLVDELGEMLRTCGFNYHGVEVLYSGVYGTELTCEIFIGPVYYQRLRHMVSDKFQVRSTGTMDQITRQPIKGRKRGGGIRFGEMERDSLLAHGAAYLLHDRLHTCSDYHVADVCSLCGSVLTATFIHPQKRAIREIGGLPPARAPKKVTCHACQTSKGMETVAMPYVFRYLAAELAAMNIKITLQLGDGATA
ncbi:DNA-directed RNA polymerase I subunit 2 [Citrus sinensis]|uniref:DNA-directed RNA polymerase I subunit 2 n=1 Tax=Citrus sinensis TaxID=2711 RepID=A0ACB8JLT3_CITSI|nr:DNA-directed RNA polymerase I subunit 2 [Citrus sinensis]